jgi:hypothetical protein
LNKILKEIEPLKEAGDLKIKNKNNKNKEIKKKIKEILKKNKYIL